MPTFTPAGDMPSGYAGLFSNLVRGPNGTIIQAPQFSGPTSVDEIYRGIIPTPSTSDPIGPGTDWSSLIGMTGDPLYFGEPNTTYGQAPETLSATRSEQVRPRIVPTIPVNGSAGGAQALKAIADLVGIPQASGTTDNGKDQSQLNTTLLAFNGDEGASVPLPGVRPNPTANVPLPRIRPVLAPAGGVSITVPYSSPGTGGGNGGSAGEGSYTVKRGDTLSAISRMSGVPVSILAAVNGISNPNKIYAGQKLSFGSLAAPSPMPSPMFARNGVTPMLTAPQISQADPWQGLRINEAPSVPGLVAASPAAAAFAPQRDTGQSGGGTIYTNPTKYGATQADRNAAAAQRAAFLAQWGG